MVASSKVPTRVFMSWADMDKDDKNDTSKNAAQHMMPDLPGKAARRVLGEVGVTLYAKIDAKGQYVWQTKPAGDVAGRGLKGRLGWWIKCRCTYPRTFKSWRSISQRCRCNLNVTQRDKGVWNGGHAECV